MGIVEICISFQVAILGIAYPIILQVITDLDNKYSSVLVTELFEGESVWKVFKWVLWVSLVSTLFYIVKAIWEIWGEVGEVLIYCLGSMIVGSAILLVISFILFIHKILKYYYPKRFVQYLIKKDNENS